MPICEPIIRGLISDIFTEPARMCIFLQKENKNNQEDYRKHVLGICKNLQQNEKYFSDPITDKLLRGI